MTVWDSTVAASTADNEPATVPNGGREDPVLGWSEAYHCDGFLYFLQVCWDHADSQLRGRLQLEARILRRREVERLTLLSKASIYRQMQLGTFPMPLKLRQRAIAWRADEINEWIASRARATGDVPRTGALQ